LLHRSWQRESSRNYDGGARVPATMAAIADGIRWAEQILKRIDEKWPVRDN